MHRGVQHATLAVHAANQRFAQQVNWNVQLLLVAQFAALTYGRQLLANDNTIWMRTCAKKRGVLCASGRRERRNVGSRCGGIKHQASEQSRGQ